jgi:ferredoxin
MAPDYFELDATHRSAPLREVVDDNGDVLDAAECCPTEAITVVDADTGEPVTG